MTVRLISKGRPLSPADIATLEGRLQVSLPADYQEFLLANNAAVPEQNIYKKWQERGRRCRIAKYFKTIEGHRSGNSRAQSCT
jgi:hypothetical protein